ncbi:collagen-like protein [Paenibacillus chartarius]|uniref:Collagen-like protein n=1 Tax=Paenibacillus chartarius TaxID=747481 RepID=A0ABV6DHV2_9BACL
MGFMPPPQGPGNPFGPFFPQGQWPGSGPFTPPHHGPGSPGQQAPTSPPPSFVPQAPQQSLYAVDPGAISGCLFRFTYVWLNHGGNFWFYPVFVGRRSVAGYRWTGFHWMYFGIDLNQIRTFTCY